jgi:aminopeptidase N
MHIQRAGCRNILTKESSQRVIRPSLGFCLLVFCLSLSGLKPAPAADPGSDRAHYSAGEPADFQHMRLQLTFTPDGLKARTCEGRVEYTIKPRATEINAVQLDAVDMRILGVELPGHARPPAFSYDDKVLTIQLPQPVRPDETFELAVKYRLEEPRKGMHFVLPNASAPARPLMVYTMSEPLEARYWVPAHDWPNARWTSDIDVTVPVPYSVVANGMLVEKKPSTDGKANTFHWRNEKPTDPHLMGLVVGELVEQSEQWRGKPVLTYTQPGTEAAARFTFRHVPEMLELYSNLIGCDFPYPSYAHITVVDHHHGGMEHAGFSFVSPFYIADSDDGDWPLENTESWLIAHMLAHQWFGGVVNYRSVSQAWLNEGFATYLDTLWTSHREMPDRLEYQMWQKARGIAGADSSETGKPMVNRDLADVDDIYGMDGGKVYEKGAWVLHMLRHQLGNDVFWRGVRNYLHAHEWQSVETTDLRQALEQASGRDLEQFFQQWVYGHGVPRLVVDYSWDVTKTQARVTVRQTQKIDSTTPAFACPLDLQFRVAGCDTNLTVELRGSQHDFAWQLPAEPTLFCVDPHEVLLKTLTVNMPRTMLEEQARHGPTSLSRFLAVETLGKEGGAADIPLLEQTLKNDSEFWAVRRLAAEQLGRMQSEASLRVLLEAEHAGISNARVLSAVIEAMPNFAVSAQAHEIALEYAQPTQPLDVQTAAIRALGRMRALPEFTERGCNLVLAAAQKPSRRVVRLAAFGSLRALGATNAYPAVLVMAHPARGDELRGDAIRLLGGLGRADELRESTRATLTTWLEDADRAAQLAAIDALGELGSLRSLPDLERLRGGAQVDLRNAAEAAIATLRRPEEPRRSFDGVIDRLDTLEKQNQELQKRLKILSDRLDANTNASAAGKKPNVKTKK